MNTVKLFNRTRGKIVCDRVEVANTSMRRLIGLLGKHGLDEGEGLWIKPSSGVHTVGMSFAIDVIGLDRRGTVIKLWPDLSPFRVTSISWKMRSAVELPAGQIAKSGIGIGDSLCMLEE